MVEERDKQGELNDALAELFYATQVVRCLELAMALVELADANLEVTCLEIERDIMIEMQGADRHHGVGCDCEVHRSA